ncbi:MAG: Mth938-like domain-containing protein [Gammaproteobacteria bacterium]|nr:Mth938-like domain-containing protein [Gammaproteobacteria bacterium]MBD3776595.1 Mth938-like domain-containing protein [Thiotrichales bacterium]
MKFTEHRDSNVYVVKHYEPGEVKINDRRLQKSCFLNQKELVENWPCEHIDALTTEHLDALLALNPEVILLGTGEIQVFPAPQLFAYCSAKGVGLEVMHNLAACRTYNVLTTEDREVVLALIMSGASTQ